MSSQALSQSQLLKCSDDDFDSNIKMLSVKDLMGLISVLQKEMAKEQENFNGLTSALNSLQDRKSRQYKTISADMLKSQGRLTTLMNRSMKCFSQQNLQHNSPEVQVQRRNSAKMTESPKASPVKSSSVQRSRSLHTINQPSKGDTTPPPSQQNPTPVPTTSAKTVHRTGVSPHPVSNQVVGQRRPASVAGGVNGVVSEGNRATFAAGSRVSLGYVPGNTSSTSLTSLNILPQTPVMGEERRPRSKSQILLTPSPALAQHYLRASSPSPHASSPMLAHASSQPSLAASSQDQNPPDSPTEKSYVGLPSVKQLAQSFGGNPANNVPSTPSTTNYRPVIRAKSMAAPDASRKLNLTNPSSSSKVNGVPSATSAGGRVQGQYVKRTAAPKPASSAAAVENGQTELEKAHARLRSSRDMTLSSLPDKPAAPKGAATSTVQNGEREVSYFKTNLDRKKSSSSILLGQKTDFDDDASLNTLSLAKPSNDLQLGTLRRAQSREELYAIESRARTQKNALLKEIENRKGASETENVAAVKVPVTKLNKGEKMGSNNDPVIKINKEEKKVSSTDPVTKVNKKEKQGASDSVTDDNIADINTRQWGLKGNSFLAQRLEQDAKERLEQNATSASTENSEPRSVKASLQIQPSITPMGRRDGGGGLSVSILSTSRENLAEVPSQAVQKSSSQPVNSKKSSKPPPATIKTETSSKTMSESSESTKTTGDRITTNQPAAAATPATPAATVTSATKTTAAAVITSSGETEEDGDESVIDNAPRMNLINWDPRPVLEQLYSIKLMEQTAEDISHQFISMEGLMEKLPMNKKKSTLLKTWKRRFFRAKDGWVQYFETGSRDKPSETLQLMGGHVDDMGNRILGIDDGRGHYLMVRAPTDKEYGQWKVALESQTADNTKATYIQPVPTSPPHPSKKVVVIDMGSGAIRAGILGEKECLPQVFFPSVVAVHKETGKKVIGMEAYHPDVRHNSTILHPIKPSNRVDRDGVMKKFNIDVDMMSSVFNKVFTELGVDPRQYMVMLSTPQTLSDSLRSGLMNALVGNLGVQGVCMVQQSLLALYSYRATTGIIVDIGQRLEILPIYDGFVIEGGVSRCPYGSQKVLDSLKKALLETNFKFTSQVEYLLVEYIMQECCYVAFDYNQEETLCDSEPGKLKRSINLEKFNMPEGAYKSVDVEEGRFSSPEGFFNVDLWEMDYPTLHKLIFQAIQSCPMDSRRHMYRAVYLSGGVSMLPGFHERLETELRKLAPPAVTVEVHAAPNRYHAAYLGACSVASMPQFKDMAISRDEWHSQGVKAFKKWQAPSS